MLERFHASAREVVTTARGYAIEMGHPEVGAGHLLLALVNDPGGAAGAVLRDAGLTATRARAALTDSEPGAPVPALGAQDAEALRAIGIDLDAVLARIEQNFGPAGAAVGAGGVPPADAGGAPSAGAGWRGRLFGRWDRSAAGPAVGGDTVRFNARARKVLELAVREAIRLRHHHIGTEHLLLGMLRDDDGPAVKTIRTAGVETGALTTRIHAALASNANG